MLPLDKAPVTKPDVIGNIAHDDGSTFFLFKTSVVATEAAAACSKHGARLASLNTEKKIDFVTSKILLNHESAWIGASCQDCHMVNTEKWFWVNGDQLVIHNKMWKIFEEYQTPWDTT